MIRYDPHHWSDHFFDIRGTLLIEIALRVLTTVLWSVGVVWWHLHIWPVNIPATVHSVVGVALGLLLVFRTNASYDRYWEGRRLWGGIVNDSRNLVRSANELLAADRELLTLLVRWTAIFPYATMSTLRGTSEIGPAGLELEPDERVELLKSQHLALHTSQKMTALLKKAYDKGLITDRLNVALDLGVRQLIDSLGGCERIRKTPLPYAYVVHLRRALVIFCLTLPFALVADFKWFTVLAVTLVTFIFFGIEEIGVEIEGPFGHEENDLPLDDICETIYKNIYSMVGMMNPPAARDLDVRGL
jgi:putative membrane protein